MLLRQPVIVQVATADGQARDAVLGQLLRCDQIRHVLRVAICGDDCGDSFQRKSLGAWLLPSTLVPRLLTALLAACVLRAGRRGDMTRVREARLAAWVRISMQPNSAPSTLLWAPVSHQSLGGRSWTMLAVD